jgi:hypothetical protein
VLAWSLYLRPVRQTQQQDAHGNLMHLLTLDEPHDEIHILVAGTVETEDVAGRSAVEPRSPFAAGLCASRPHRPVADDAPAGVRHRSRSCRARRRRSDGAWRMAVRDAMDYVPGVTEVSDTAAQAIRAAPWRLPGPRARDDRLLPGARRARPLRQRLSACRAGDDHIASHAWVDVWLARHDRWFAIDVTNGVPGGLAALPARRRPAITSTPVRCAACGAAVAPRP